MPLVGDDRRLVGCLGIVDPERRRLLSAPAHLRPLARSAATKVARWLRGRA